LEEVFGRIARPKKVKALHAAADATARAEPVNVLADRARTHSQRVYQFLAHAQPAGRSALRKKGHHQ
jgi:hypothetical protein